MADETERQRFYQAADRLLIEEAPILPLFHERLDVLIKPWVKRFPLSPLNVMYWKDIVIEPH